MVGGAPIVHPTAEWSELHKRYYRKQELYTMAWTKMELGKFRVCGAPYGGPIAMVRDDSKILAAQKQTGRQYITFYSAAGKQLTQLLWDKGRIVGMGWSETEQLVVVLDDGTVRIYNIHGDSTQFSLGKDAKDHGVEDCRFYGNGLVALTGNFTLIAVTNFDEPRPRGLTNMNLNEPPHSWIVIEPQHTLSRTVEVLVATRESILLVDGSMTQDMQYPNAKGPVKKMAASPNGKYLALFTTTGHIEVVPIEFGKVLSSFETKSSVPPIQMVWCANDTVVAYWDGLVIMIGPYTGLIKYVYDEPIVLVPEIDGVRIVSNDKSEFLQKVPDVTERIFTIGSTDSAAMLYDALEHFEKKSPKADENIRSIKGELVIAVDHCSEAAAHEFNPYYQRMLLKSASFGKCFLDDYPADKFVETCQTLRVLNAVRHYEIGIPLTEAQYRRLTPDVLVNRLINRHHHLIALRIAEYLGMKTDRILVHWACEKVKKAEADDETVCRTIVEKLADAKGVSYSEIAQTAYKVGRPALATRLLDYEPRAAQQVPLLMDMQEDELALVKAIDSGDTELVYYVLLQLKRKLSPGDFFRLIDNKPLAMSLLEVYCKQQDLDLLKDFYIFDDRTHETAFIAVREGYESPDLALRLKSLKRAYETLKSDSNQAFAAKATEDQLKLLEFQIHLQKDVKDTIINMSLAQTIHYCLVKSMGTQATKLKSDFRMEDKQFYWIKIKATAEIRDWAELDRFSKLKSKSPIGFEPFVAECLAYNNVVEALKYIPRCDNDKKAAFYIQTKHWPEAVEAAFAVKDVNALQEVKAKSGNPKVAAQVDSYLSQLTQRR